MAWYGTSKNRSKAAANSARRRQREATDETIDRDEIWQRANGICHLCKLPVPRERFHVEHVIPLSAGGTNTADNLAPAHPRCNLKKGSRVGPRKNGLRRTAWRPKPKPLDVPDDVF